MLLLLVAPEDDDHFSRKMQIVLENRNTGYTKASGINFTLT